MNARTAKEIAMKNRSKAIKRLKEEEREKEKEEKERMDKEDKKEADLLHSSLDQMKGAAQNGKHEIKLMFQGDASKLIASLKERGFWVGEVREGYGPGAGPDDFSMYYKYLSVSW